MPAGGFRTFVAGETLDEDKINDYLMQGVLVFADSAARGSAIGTPVHGQVSFLKDTDNLEFFDGSSWTAFSPGIQVEYLVIAGGGGGGTGNDTADRRSGGGGGSGGYFTNISGESNPNNDPSSGSSVSYSGILSYLVAGTYPVTVGAGGAAGGPGGLGSYSNFVSQGYLTGGGGGGLGNSNFFKNGQVGASGGGGASDAAPSGVGGPGLPLQGCNGGTASTDDGGGGGGGAAGVGSNGAVNTGGNGGNGLANSITGSSVTRAGGGGGGGQTTRGTGGSGGGGDGAQGSTPATAGAANTGGGGGGGNTLTGAAANGGSGVVIFRVPIGTSVSFSGGVSQTSANTGTWTCYTVTAAGPSDTVTIA